VENSNKVAYQIGYQYQQASVTCHCTLTSYYSCTFTIRGRVFLMRGQSCRYTLITGGSSITCKAPWREGVHPTESHLIHQMILEHTCACVQYVYVYADFKIMCGHQSISVHLPRMTDHKCTWSVGVTNQCAWIQSPFLCFALSMLPEESPPYKHCK